ncbi:cell division protein PerM [Nocardiopsis quinghaiensis]|uniref:cell division protein PerM n=1 Tax=Nocardiopsis quinghaiensis TaxID=464995 RepID=UPI003743E32D
MSTPGSPPDRGRPSQRLRTSGADAPRPVYSTGGIAAATAAGLGLAVIITLAIIGWVAAPHDAFGEEIVDILQGAVLAWLVGHHVSFSVPDGQIALLPLGLVLVPGLLLYRSGRWLARSCSIPRLRYVYRAALAIAGPYAAIAGTLALLARTETVEPSMPRALVMGFVIAFLSGGLGALRQLMLDKGVAARDLLDLMPARSRSLLVGMLVSTGTLLLGGLLLFLVALAINLPEAVETTRALRPGLVGGVLLLVVQLAYLPNAVVFSLCYALGPGFAVGTGTVVAPMGVSAGALPMLPMLAAVPENGAAPVASLIALAVPFVAGAMGGVLTQRSAPDVVSEAAPLWGFVCGVTTGMLCAALAEVAGGPLGGERLSEVGPSAWQVGLVAALEVGVAAAVAAWTANWWYTRGRRPVRSRPAPRKEPEARPEPKPRPEPRLPTDVPVGEGLATVTPLRRREDGDSPSSPGQDGREDTGRADRAAERAERRRARRELRERRREERRARRAEGGRWWRRGSVEDEESEELYGITYEAAPGDTDAPRG